jgi:3-oxoacyl-[acyl-carrier protein] reductase
VTEGNRGIGLAIALGFAAQGAKAAICGRDLDALAQSKKAIEACGVQAAAVAVDLFTAKACELAVAATVEAFGGLDILVNNASTNISGQFETLNDEQLMERFMGKTLASMRCCRAALPHLRSANGGRIICSGGASVRSVRKTSLPSGLGCPAQCPISTTVRRSQNTERYSSSQSITARLYL